MSNNLGQNERVYIRLYKPQANRMPSASFPATPPGIATMLNISAEGLRDFKPVRRYAADEVGGNHPAVMRQATEIVDLTALTFSVLYNNATSPGDKLETDDAHFNHTYCNGWLAWVTHDRAGTAAGKPRSSYPVVIESCLKVKDGADAWRLNVTARGYDLPVDGDQA